MLEITSLKDIRDKHIHFYNEKYFSYTDFEITSIVCLSCDFTSPIEIQLRIKGNSETKRIIKETFDDLYHNENMQIYFEYYNLFTFFIDDMSSIERFAYFLKEEIDKIRNVIVNSLYNDSHATPSLNLGVSMKKLNIYISNLIFPQFLFTP